MIIYESKPLSFFPLPGASFGLRVLPRSPDASPGAYQSS